MTRARTKKAGTTAVKPRTPDGRWKRGSAKVRTARLDYPARRQRLLSELRDASGDDRRVIVQALNALEWFEREQVSERAAQQFVAAGLALAQALRQQEAATDALASGIGSVQRVREAEHKTDEARRAFEDARTGALLAKERARRR